MNKTAAIIALFIFSPLTHAADVYVNGSTGTDNGWCGVIASLPCETVKQGVIRAGSGTNLVKIAGGDYSESIVINSSIAGLTLQGGWSADFSTQTCDPNLTVVQPESSNSSVLRLSSGAWTSISVNISCLTFKGENDDSRRGIYLATSHGTITLNMDQSIIDGFAGNGLYLWSNVSGSIDVAIHRSVFRDAYQPVAASPFSGGGIDATALGGSKQTIILENCLLFNNEAKVGAAINVGSGESNSAIDLSLTNTTLTGNRSIGPGTGASIGVTSAEDTGQTTAHITNSIVWGNTSLGGMARDIFIVYNSTVNTRYSIIGEVYNHPNAPGTYIDNGYNSNIDPRLNSSYHLKAGSPAIDSAQCGYYNYSPPSLQYVRVAPYYDIDGDARPVYGALTGCDIGADEWYSKAMPWLMLLLE